MQPISTGQNPSSRIFTESELKLQATKTPHELELKPFSKTGYKYYSTVDYVATVSIINDIHTEVQNGEKYFFLNTYSPFVAKQKQDKKIEWLSVNAVDANQVLYVGKPMTKKGDQSFYINTGSHGSPNGDSVMLKPEMATNNPGVSWKVGRFKDWVV